MLTPRIEEALLACGRDRVYHNSGAKPSVAVRWAWPQGPGDTDREEQWIVGEGADHDEAGAQAALRFAKRLRERGESLLAWADSIEKKLKAR